MQFLFFLFVGVSFVSTCVSVIVYAVAVVSLSSHTFWWSSTRALLDDIFS